MKNPFQIGDTKTFMYTVLQQDSATFESREVHPVYATFALAREAEWSGRLFVLEMKEEGEEGIGTKITVNHHSPALIGQDVEFTATLVSVNKNEIVTDYTAKIKGRLVADGTQIQKIVNKEKINRLFQSLT